MSRIVHWGKYFPPDLGGIESVTSSIAEAAAGTGYEVTVVCFHQGPVQRETTPAGIDVLRAPVELLRASQPMGLRYFRGLLRESREASIVHLHAPNFAAAVAAVMLNPRAKLLVHWHSDVMGKGLLGRVLKPLEAAMLRRADRIICTSPTYAAASPTLKPFADKVRVVPIGVSDGAASAPPGPNALPPGLEARLQGRRLLLAVGRLVPYKGFSVLVEAASRLPADAVVVVVGDGTLRTPLEAQIQEAGLQDRVILAGRLGQEALKSLFRRAELFCLPSVERSEAFGVVLAEAMSHSLPIVATQIPGSGVPWVNQHGVSGLNVPVADPVRFADACNEILASGALRQQLAMGARQRYEQEFTEAIANRKMLAVYEGLLAAESGSGRAAT